MTASRRYDVRIKRSAEKELSRLPSKIFHAIANAILALETNPRPRGCKRLRGTEGYRIRSGDYRILFTIENRRRLIEVIAIGHRREVYRDL